MHRRTHSPACTCGARWWRLETLPVDEHWVGYCHECGAERRWPIRFPETIFPKGEYESKRAHAPARTSHIAIKPSTCERTW